MALRVSAYCHPPRPGSCWRLRSCKAERGQEGGGHGAREARALWGEGRGPELPASFPLPVTALAPSGPRDGESGGRGCGVSPRAHSLTLPPRHDVGVWTPPRHAPAKGVRGVCEVPCTHSCLLRGDCATGIAKGGRGECAGKGGGCVSLSPSCRVHIANHCCMSCFISIFAKVMQAMQRLQVKQARWVGRRPAH